MTQAQVTTPDPFDGHCIAIGHYAAVSGQSAVAIGNGASATGDHAVAIGHGASATGANAVAIGDLTRWWELPHA